ncbi:hypothetical protein [uncultured Microbulbifer sp.]|uniref:hypothetical protein n=1 Tax=uncultured Microbulbifer sp. TaxID=348147 RepID=UPI0025F05956|nr:hypothetical protein [uncultured Microbulbifer sp.]
MPHSTTSYRGISVQKLSCILLAAAVAAGIVAGCTATEPRESHANRAFTSAIPPNMGNPDLRVKPQESTRRSPRALNVNGTKFRCFERELETKIVVRCVRES